MWQTVIGYCRWPAYLTALLTVRHISQYANFAGQSCYAQHSSNKNRLKNLEIALFKRRDRVIVTWLDRDIQMVSVVPDETGNPCIQTINAGPDIPNFERSVLVCSSPELITLRIERNDI